MIRIHYLDRDQAFYNDLSSWLPDYCTLSPVTIESILNISSYDPGSDIILINPDYTGNSLDYLKPVLQRLHNIPVIFISDTISLPFVVSMIKNGAFSFLHKRKDKSMLIECIKEILYKTPIHDDSINMNHSSLSDIIGSSRSMLNLKNDILNYNGNNLNIILNGESGTGKELAAKALHSQNFSNTDTLIAVNCGAIPDTLLESELFGTKKGAYTDAIDKIGLFERANGGTIFLDEVAELSKSAQVKLLRVLEDGIYCKVGGTDSCKSQFNLITATNKNLKKEMSEGRFREDLYYRITSLVINIPPLRERKEDIYELSQYFLNKMESNKDISKTAFVKMIEHSWPGNIRELKHTLARAEYLSRKNKTIEPNNIVFY